MIRYLIYLLGFIPMRLLTFPLAPIAVLLFRDPFNPYRLTFPFGWMMTDDYDLRGDPGWAECHVTDPTSIWSMIKWMWRNGGHRASYRIFGMPVGRNWFWKVKEGKGWTYRLGWNPNDFKNGRSKINLAVRHRK